MVTAAPGPQAVRMTDPDRVDEDGAAPAAPDRPADRAPEPDASGPEERPEPGRSDGHRGPGTDGWLPL